MADARARQGAEGVEVPLDIDTASAHQQLSAVEARLVKMQMMFGRIAPGEVLGSDALGGNIEMLTDGTVSPPPRVYPGQPLPSSLGISARSPHAVAAGMNPSAARLAMARIAYQAFRADPQRFESTVSATQALTGAFTRDQQIAGTSNAMPSVQQMLDKRVKLSNLARMQGIRGAGGFVKSAGWTVAKAAAGARAVGIPLPRFSTLLRSARNPALVGLYVANGLNNIAQDPEQTAARMEGMRTGGGREWAAQLAKQTTYELIGKPAEEAAGLFSSAARFVGDKIGEWSRSSQTLGGELLGAMGIDSAQHARARRARQDEEDRQFAVRRAAAKIREQLAKDPSGIVSATRNLAQRLVDGGRFESFNETLRELRPLVEQRAVLDELRRQGLQATADDLGRQG